MIYTGGMCGNMSKIGRGTYISLGQPAIQAGQPKHACLITYSQSNGKYSAIINQTVSSAYKTTCFTRSIPESHLSYK